MHIHTLSGTDVSIPDPAFDAAGTVKLPMKWADIDTLKVFSTPKEADLPRDDLDDFQEAWGYHDEDFKDCVWHYNYPTPESSVYSDDDSEYTSDDEGSQYSYWTTSDSDSKK